VRDLQVLQEVLVFFFANWAGRHSSLPPTVIKTFLHRSPNCYIHQATIFVCNHVCNYHQRFCLYSKLNNYRTGSKFKLFRRSSSVSLSTPPDLMELVRAFRLSILVTSLYRDRLLLLRLLIQVNGFVECPCLLYITT
jgi:hypothetical protein